MERHEGYDFEIFEDPHGCGFYYEIYTDDPDYLAYNRTNILRESDMWFDAKQEARFAAIGHIELLLSGEG